MIYHPHGYIPSPSETENLDDCQIVLSLDEYCENIRDVFSWVNDTQVHLLSHYTGIMIGSSFSDLTTQRMMYYATMNGNNDKIYYEQYINLLLKSDESIENYTNLYNEFIDAYNLRKNILSNLHKEIKIIKKLKV